MRTDPRDNKKILEKPSETELVFWSLPTPVTQKLCTSTHFRIDAVAGGLRGDSDPSETH